MAGMPPEGIYKASQPIYNPYYHQNPPFSTNILQFDTQQKDGHNTHTTNLNAAAATDDYIHSPEGDMNHTEDGYSEIENHPVLGIDIDNFQPRRQNLEMVKLQIPGHLSQHQVQSRVVKIAGLNPGEQEQLEKAFKNTYEDPDSSDSLSYVSEPRESAADDFV